MSWHYEKYWLSEKNLVSSCIECSLLKNSLNRVHSYKFISSKKKTFSCFEPASIEPEAILENF